LSVAGSPLAGRVIFIEGAPRSGTTLLVSMLATHPEIAGTAAESHLFDRGVGQLFDNHERDARYEGFLSNYVSEPELVDLLRDFCDGVLLTMRERIEPDASRVVEKTPLPPRNARQTMERKLEIYPDATYVHVVRDRDAVVRSLMRAPWADCDEAGAAEWWRGAVAAIRETAGAGSARYTEIAYEDLAADPVDAVAGLLGELGLEVDDVVRERLAVASRERSSSFGPAVPDEIASGVPPPAAVGGGRAPAAEQGGIARSIGILAQRVLRRHRRNSRIAQRLLVAARQDDAAAVGALTHPAFSFQLRSGAGDLAADGPAGREALLAVAREIFGAGFITESWMRVGDNQTACLLFSAAHSDGRRTELVATARVRGGLVEALGLLVAGAPGGSMPDTWAPAVSGGLP
jgi:hypothetical protein